RVATRVAERLRPQVVVAEGVMVGVSEHHMNHAGTLTLRPGTFLAVLNDLIRSVVKAGFEIVLINGHGGNDFIPLIRQIQQDMGVHLFLVDWWKVGHDRYEEIFTASDDHAGQFETSVALHLFPELVELDAAGDGAVREFRFEALRAGWARTSRDFGKLSDQCAVGDPSGASAERGREYLELVIGRIADFLVELAEAPIDEHFPFRPDVPGAGS
ncbi:hypothetical protein LCGC14_1963050, partial [marine sediment metagenome]